MDFVEKAATELCLNKRGGNVHGEMKESFTYVPGNGQPEKQGRKLGLFHSVCQMLCEALRRLWW
jgi:hypothetical protein